MDRKMVLLIGMVLVIGASGISITNATSVGRSVSRETLDFQNDFPENVRFEVVLPYLTTDNLYQFERQGSMIILYSNCAFASGCDLFGFWNDPFPLVNEGSGLYSTTYTIATVNSVYEFAVQSDGTVLVSGAHDQCYPSGCSNPPLEPTGTFAPLSR